MLAVLLAAHSSERTSLNIAPTISTSATHIIYREPPVTCMQIKFGLGCVERTSQTKTTVLQERERKGERPSVTIIMVQISEKEWLTSIIIFDASG